MPEIAIHPHPSDLKQIDPLVLSQELQSVYATEEETKGAIGPLISSHNASPDKAIEWWRANDPIRETFAQKAFHRAHNLHGSERIDANLAELQSQALGIRASLTVLAGFAFPTVFEETAKDWTNRLAQNFPDADQEAVSKGRLDALVTKIGNGLQTRIEQIRERGMPVTASELERLSIGREMLNDTYGFLQPLFTNGSMVYEGFSKEQTREMFERIDYFNGIIHNFLCDCIMMPEPSDSKDTEALMEADSIRMLGFYNFTLQIAHLESYSSKRVEKGAFWDETINSPELRKAVLNRLLWDLDYVFGSNQHTTMSERLKANKGAIHETLWFLDTVMMRHMWPGRYNDVIVWPSNHNSDKPIIGRPDHNRAYDFMVRKPGRSKDTEVVDYVQVKSAPQADKAHKKKYHPVIWTYEEDPFKEVQLRRLRAKLRIYQDIFDRGFDKEDSTLLEGYLMKTPKQAMDNAWLRRHDRTWEMLQIIADTKSPNLFGLPTPQFIKAGPNRAERRAAARRKKATGSFKS